MRHLFLALILTFGLSIATGYSALAKIPTEVLEPYKAYAAAKEKGDEKATYENAKKAWQAAEKSLGASKTTGDLAHNFAELFALGKNPYKNYKTRLKARKRSIELSKFYPENEIAPTEIDRRLKLAEMSMMLRIRNGFNSEGQEGGYGSYFDDVERALEKHQLQGSTFDGDLNVLKARFYNLRKKYDNSIKYADIAIEIYKNRTDTWSSPYPYYVRLFKGDSYKGMNKPILAALEYQSVMQNLEGKLPADHPFVSKAFSNWMKTRSGLEDAGRLEEAEKAGLCECWPFEDYKDKVTPLQRIPPKMPSSFARGRNSGHVIVMFDVDDDGKPLNIRKVSSTSKKLEQPAIQSVAKWKFSKRNPAEPENARKDVSNKISFRLMDTGGNILPEP